MSPTFHNSFQINQYDIWVGLIWSLMVIHVADLLESNKAVIAPFPFSFQNYDFVSAAKGLSQAYHYNCTLFR